MRHFFLFIFLFSSAAISEEETQQEFLAGFVLGNYQVVGANPKNNQPYIGTLEIRRTNDSKLEIIRNIDNNKILAKAEIVPSGIENHFVLSASWVENNIGYLASYMIDGDFNNYARLTGYIWLKNDKTKRAPEAIFYATKQ